MDAWHFWVESLNHILWAVGKHYDVIALACDACPVICLVVRAVDGHIIQRNDCAIDYRNLIVASECTRQHIAVLCHIVASELRQVNRVGLCFLLARVGVALSLDGQLIGVMVSACAIPLDGELANLIGQRILTQRLQGILVHQQLLWCSHNLLDGGLAFWCLVGKLQLWLIDAGELVLQGCCQLRFHLVVAVLSNLREGHVHVPNLLRAVWRKQSVRQREFLCRVMNMFTPMVCCQRWHPYLLVYVHVVVALRIAHWPASLIFDVNIAHKRIGSQRVLIIAARHHIGAAFVGPANLLAIGVLRDLEFLDTGGGRHGKTCAICPSVRVIATDWTTWVRSHKTDAKGATNSVCLRVRLAHGYRSAGGIVVGRWLGILQMNGAFAHKVHSVIATTKPGTISTKIRPFVLLVRAVI